MQIFSIYVKMVNRMQGMTGNNSYPNNESNRRVGNTRKRKANNSNNNQPSKISGREVMMPTISPGKGMACGHAGIPRYMKRAKKKFDDKGVVTAFFDYTIPTGQYGILKNIDAIIKRRGQANTNSRIIATNQIHYFMVGIRDHTSNGHAVNILVDPGLFGQGFRMWVFDPHGRDAQMTIWGQATRNSIVPIIKSMWGVGINNGNRVRYYNGMNLQANNRTIGSCTTFYVTFMDYIEDLLSGASINNIRVINSANVRKNYLERRGGNFENRRNNTPSGGVVIARNVRQ